MRNHRRLVGVALSSLALICSLSARGEEPGSTKQILFGDLHVHTTFSTDAFLGSLPIMQGDGPHPISDACDFARYCSDLDFWAITDHAITINSTRWTQTKQSARACQATAGNGNEPDLVTFLGFEWTQVGATADNHYGHKNVIFHDLDEESVPRRPIDAGQETVYDEFYTHRAALWYMLKWPFFDFAHHRQYFDFLAYMGTISEEPLCEEDIDTRKLPTKCREVAHTPEALFTKLDQWDFDTLVIPHGNAWGLYTPPGTNWHKQLAPKQHDPSKQRLIEVYSGHGNSEEYRDWRAVGFDEAGKAYCPAPTEDYLPCCWRAGEIIEARCTDKDSERCQRRVREARQKHAELGALGHLTISGESVEDWGNCGQCTDCFLPAFNHRPKSSVQYALAISNFDAQGKPETPQNFRFGLLASSDNHTARPGTGYKQYERRRMTESFGPSDAKWIERIYNHHGKPTPETVPRSKIHTSFPMFNVVNWERASSFFLTGGLVATHASGRNRDAIWDALKRREVYGTSGPRILLWFDLVNGPEGSPLPMGSEMNLGEVPHFRVRAAGAFKQKPGCPEHSLRGLSPERLTSLCRGECLNPSDVRHRIERIEVVRIRPQIHPNEPVGKLIEDPWRSFPCPDDPAGCSVEFGDPEFPASGRQALYYVRAIQEATPTINGGGLRCTYDNTDDDPGRCIAVHPCYSDARTDLADDCLAEAEQRAWSSPIFVQPDSTAGAQPISR